MIKIEKIARYPLEFTKGTSDQRTELARALNYRFFQNISKQFKSKDVSFDVFQKTLDDACPFHKNISLIKSPNKGGAVTIKVNDESKNIIGYNMLIPANQFSG
jgi:hypothetical protein